MIKSEQVTRKLTHDELSWLISHKKCKPQSHPDMLKLSFHSMLQKLKVKKRDKAAQMWINKQANRQQKYIYSIDRSEGKG